MNGDDLIPLLGKPYGDPALDAFLKSLAITKAPKRKRGDDTVVLGNERLGVEITFRDEQCLDVRSVAYMEGDLVLSNVRLYGPGHARFAAFAEVLPLGLRFDLSSAEVERRLGGKPAWADRDLAKSRWDLAGYCVFVTFEKQGSGIRSVAVQLPVA
jgi:hypothetical protein